MKEELMKEIKLLINDIEAIEWFLNNNLYADAFVYADELKKQVDSLPERIKELWRGYNASTTTRRD